MEVDESIGQFFAKLISWSPTLQIHWGRIDYWHSVLCINTGIVISKNATKRLSIKLSEYSEHYLTALACLDKLKIAWKEY